MGLTLFLLGLLYVVLFVVIGWALGGTSGAWVLALRGFGSGPVGPVVLL